MADLSAYGSCILQDGACSTCGDVAVPVRVVQLAGAGSALCEDRSGARAEIALEFVGPVISGDVLMTHAGVALAKIVPPQEVPAT